MDSTASQHNSIKSINVNESLIEAAIRMMNEKISCLIVNDDNGKFTGLLTERDIANQMAQSTREAEFMTVGQVMTKQVISCQPGTSADKAREIMTANNIRHLPIVENGNVVGMLSIRDLMQQQIIEDREAAQEVAMLSKCLKSIDLNEAADIVTKEVPKLFHAENCVLCLFKDNSEDGEAELLSYNKCPCPKQNLWPTDSIESILSDKSPEVGDEPFAYEDIPQVCRKQGAEGPRLVIPLTIAETSNDNNSPSAPVLIGEVAKEIFVEPESKKQHNLKKLTGYLCMCRLANGSDISKEVTSYKARLTKDILTSHLTNASLYQHARLTSLTDALTGIGSRKLLEDRLQVETARAKRYKRPFSVAIIDLDNFKTINDVLGHATGDEALRKLADCMKKQKRVPDILARYGGDEFVILMPETKAEDAVTLLERIRSEVQKIKVAENFSMTISCGISQSQTDADDASGNIVRRADLALYSAKSAGRNCVKLWDKTMKKTLNEGDIEIEKIKKLRRRVAGLSEQAENMFIQSIWGLVQALEAKDSYTKKHSENVMQYAVGIAKTMNISPKQTDIIRRAAMIHDIGKIGVPDAILSKLNQLVPREQNIIQQHPLIAVRILEKMSFLEHEIEVIRHHHEKWNGQGYPDGLSKKSIPLGARVLAVADSFDALTSTRAYHESRSIDEALKILVDSAGYDFDPEVTKALVKWIENVAEKLDKVGQTTTEDLLNWQNRQSEELTTEPAEKETIAV